MDATRGIRLVMIAAALAIVAPRLASAQAAEVVLSVDPGSTSTVTVGPPCSPGPIGRWNEAGGLGGWVKHGNIVMVGGRMVFNSNDRPPTGRAVSPDVQLPDQPIRVAIQATIEGVSPGVAFRVDVVDGQGRRTIAASGDIAGPTSVQADFAGRDSISHLEIIDLTSPTTSRDLVISSVVISVPDCATLSIVVAPAVGSAMVVDDTTVSFTAPDVTPAMSTMFVVARCLPGEACSETRVSVDIAASPTTTTSPPPPTAPPPSTAPPPTTAAPPSTTSVDPTVLTPPPVTVERPEPETSVATSTTLDATAPPSAEPAVTVAGDATRADNNSGGSSRRSGGSAPGASTDGINTDEVATQPDSASAPPTVAMRPIGDREYSTPAAVVVGSSNATTGNIEVGQADSNRETDRSPTAGVTASQGRGGSHGSGLAAAPGGATSAAPTDATQAEQIAARGDLPTDESPIDGLGEGTALGGLVAVLALAAASGGGRETPPDVTQPSMFHSAAPASAPPIGGTQSAPQSADIDSPTTSFRGVDAEETGEASTSGHARAPSEFDRRSKHAPERLAIVSPLLGRIGADGGYLRAIVYRGWIVLPVAALALGAWAGSVATGLVPPAVPLALLACVAIIDSAVGLAALVGLLLVAGPGDLGSWPDVRLMFGVASLSVAPALVASGLRPLRRPIERTVKSWMSALVDLVALPLFTSFVVTNMVAELPALGGVAATAIPAAAHARSIGAACGFTILARMIVERIVTATRADRLADVEPPTLPAPHARHPMVALPLRAALFLLVASGFLPWCWELFVGTAFFVVGPILARPAVVKRLPDWSGLRRFLPAGLIGFAVMFFIGRRFGGWLGSKIDDPMTMLRTGFVVLALPGLLLTVLRACSAPRPEPPADSTATASGVSASATAPR